MTDHQIPDLDRTWFAVAVCSGAAPVTGDLGVTIGRLTVREVEFAVVLDEEDVPKLADAEERFEAGRREAATYAAGNIAAWTDWPAGEYLVTVRGKDSATTYHAQVDEDRTYTVRKQGE